jgi:hypothetical protein
MIRFRVWLRPLQPTDYDYLILVDGMENARWLMTQLTSSFVFGSARPIQQASDSSLCTFQVPRTSLFSFSKLKALLVAMPEVTLLQQPIR